MCNSVRRRRWLNWAVVVKSFIPYIRSEELRDTLGLKVKERKARDERERSLLHYAGYVPFLLQY